MDPIEELVEALEDMIVAKHAADTFYTSSAESRRLDETRIELVRKLQEVLK